MQITTMGLVLRATKTGENDKALLILTPEHGLISAMAKGSLRLKNKLFSGTGLFCYSEFTLFSGKTMYVVDEAEVREVFFGIHEDITSMALAMYIAELAGILSPHGDEASAQLRLILNTFHLLSKKKREPLQLKMIFELRTMCNSGFMPDLVACSKCMCYNADSFYFDIDTSNITCADCLHGSSNYANIDMPSVSAMRHIAYSDDSTLFNFTLAQESLKACAQISERYTLACIDKAPKTLEFLHGVL